MLTMSMALTLLWPFHGHTRTWTRNWELLPAPGPFCDAHTVETPDSTAIKHPLEKPLRARAVLHEVSIYTEKTASCQLRGSYGSPGADLSGCSPYKRDATKR